ncbi:glycosyltransferase [Vibrio antiquarius]|uniref:glycosyltransferase n=1 Tax=Vibrio antiquarius (strain Ex25) TaxID=150340 RepID=UPI00265A24F9|nr:glycosyltransferase family 2 protein [Vibrio antiquarius]MCR9580131.1 glycosyltransferase family 2 protein [Vibrio antiquarius]MCR9619814.1 glycosyltransferase family 2 protein [Vibrio antiquarius]
MIDFKNIAVVTTAKNESKNIDKLVDGIIKQNGIKTWVFIDDNSDDNTLVALHNRYSDIEKYVENFIVINLDSNDNYELGPKYSKNIKLGFDHIIDFEVSNSIIHEFFAILDADNFIENGYYSNLISEFRRDSTLGIASGKTVFIIDDKMVDSNESNRWAAGSNRVWRRDCLLQSGYLISYSADAVSAARARSYGWKVCSFSSAKVFAREVGERVGQEYYGRSCYIRHVPFYFVLLSAVVQVLKGRFHVASGLIRGFNQAKRVNENRITDELAIKYFQLYLYNNIKERLSD